MFHYDDIAGKKIREVRYAKFLEFSVKTQGVNHDKRYPYLFVLSRDFITLAAFSLCLTSR